MTQSDTAIAAAPSYTLAPLGGGVIRSDGAHVPPDPANTDWQAYLAWRAAGHTAAGATAR